MRCAGCSPSPFALQRIRTAATPHLRLAKGRLRRLLACMAPAGAHVTASPCHLPLKGKAFSKKGAGRMIHSPRCSSRFALRAYFVRVTHVCASGGQNLAALCTTAGQNLTAVGSSHSLTETVNLGTMTTAGLIGTLHNTYTSCNQNHYARQPNWPQQHIVNDYNSHARPL